MTFLAKGARYVERMHSNWKKNCSVVKFVQRIFNDFSPERRSSGLRSPGQLPTKASGSPSDAAWLSGDICPDGGWSRVAADAAASPTAAATGSGWKSLRLTLRSESSASARSQVWQSVCLASMPRVFPPSLKQSNVIHISNRKGGGILNTCSLCDFQPYLLLF